MSKGLATTFEILTKTGNEAAVRVLIPALDSAIESIREKALETILGRRSLAGHREVLRRLHVLPENHREIVGKHRNRLSRAIRDAVLDPDGQMCANGCRAAVWFREYDLIPSLLTVLEDRANENAPMVVAALTELINLLYETLSQPRDYSDRRDPQLIRQRVVGALEESVKRFDHHGRREVIEAFLLLVERSNVTLRQVLSNLHHSAYLAMVDVLSTSTRGGIIRLLLNFLEDSNFPTSLLPVLSKRGDLKFIQHLLAKLGREPSAPARANLKRIKSLVWLQHGEPLLEQFDEAAQFGAVRLVMATKVPRQDAFAVIEYLAIHGKTEGRRAAAKALDEFNGADANALVMKVVSDPDPEVQAAAVRQVRRRGMPGALPRLIEMLDSPHEIVRGATMESLAEFTFGRYLGAFDILDDDVRYSTAMLVKKVDPQAATLLEEELASKVRTRRLRGLEVAEVMGEVERLESQISELLRDEDHLVRVAAATTLARSSGRVSQQALQDALSDRSEAVRRAARGSLDQRAAMGRLPGILLDLEK